MFVINNFIAKYIKIYAAHTNTGTALFCYKEQHIVMNGKIWLATPTMHGDELKYIKEAYPYVNKENFNEVMDRVYREIEVASQKCPIIKDEIQKFLTTQKRMVVEAMIKMRKLQQENGDKKKEIEELTQIIQESKQKINYIAPKER